MFDIAPQARAARGARWLDRREPGWAGRVDPDRLDILSARNCVWGQLYGNYRSLSASLLFFGRQRRFGFYPDRDLGFDWDARDLTEAWRNEIRYRRGEIADGYR